MISGSYPFEGEVPFFSFRVLQFSQAIMKLFDNIANQPLTLPENVEISTFLVDVLHGVLHKDPKKRLCIEGIKHSEWFNRNFDVSFTLLILLLIFYRLVRSPSTWRVGRKHTAR